MTNSNKKILIIDDHDETRETYVELFKKSGFDVIEAKDGIEGLDKVTSEEGIDVIFTGIIMPRMDGFQLMQALKKNTSTANIPVFINSHLGREEDRKKAMELGAKDFIVKGMTPLNEAVKIILRQLGSEKYLLKINHLELDGQKFIQDLNLPEELACDNCGSGIAINLIPQGTGEFKATLECSSCKKQF